MKITTIGEILVDMTQTHVDANQIPHFAANPGGAPANVAVGVVFNIKIDVENPAGTCIVEHDGKRPIFRDN